jgi:hypothetical protein
VGASERAQVVPGRRGPGRFKGENAGAVKTALIGPLAMAANASIQWDFPSGIVLTVSESLTADSSSNTAVTVFAYGRIK